MKPKWQEVLLRILRRLWAEVKDLIAHWNVVFLLIMALIGMMSILAAVPMYFSLPLWLDYMAVKIFIAGLTVVGLANVGGNNEFESIREPV